MTNSAWLLKSLALVLLLTMPGCRESYTIVTTLFADGSCDRVITVSSDSMRIPSVAFPLPIDSTWETNWKAPTQKGEKYLFTARKRFAHIDSLRQEYSRINDSSKIRISVNVEESFRWFYTYFTYTEKYEAFNPLGQIPLSEFMTADEIQRFLAGERSDSLKKKRDAWEMRNMFEVYYQGLLDAAGKLHHRALPASLIEAKKEELYAELMSSNSNDVVKVTTAVLRTSAVRKLSREIRALEDEIMRRSELAARADGDYVSTVVMPGTILDTNAGEVKGNSVVWRFSDEQLGIADYEMRVESRRVNIWPLAVTGLVVLALILLPTTLRMRRERHLVATRA